MPRQMRREFAGEGCHVVTPMMRKNTVTSILWIIVCQGLMSLAAPGQELPPGVPSPIGPDGKMTSNTMFTTPAYQRKAIDMLVQEANKVAAELHLSEKLPITEADIIGAYIAPFGMGYVRKYIGNITTHNYNYAVLQNYKFSSLTKNDFDNLCKLYEKKYVWPLSRMDTNGAYRLAAEWLAALSVDVKALDHDCPPVVKADNVYLSAPSGKFVPVYWVMWPKPTNEMGGSSVMLCLPTKTLLQLYLDDPKYIKRAPLVFTNLAELLAHTNKPPSAPGSMK